MSFLNSTRFRGALIITSVLGLSLGACREERPQLRAPSLGWPASLSAPYPVEPPYEGPAPIGQLVSYDDGYAWAERSYAMDDAFYGAQPDYGFYYDGAQPYVWQTADDWAMYAEPYQDDYRFYYYEPGDYYPYFIRDADYGYGYDDVGRLVVIYDIFGRVMPQSFLYERGDLAGDYYRRAYTLRNASYTTQHITIVNNIWRVQEPRVRRAQTIWIDAAGSQDDWVRYRTRTGERDLRAFRRDERQPILTRVSRTVAGQQIDEGRGSRKPDRVVEPEHEPRAKSERPVREIKVKREEARAERPQKATIKHQPRAEAKSRNDPQARREQRALVRDKPVQAEKRGQATAEAKSVERREQAQMRSAELRQQRKKAEPAKARVEAKAETRRQAQTERRPEHAKARRAEPERRQAKVERVKSNQVETKARPARAETERRQQPAKRENRVEAQKQVREQRTQAAQGPQKQREAKQTVQASKASPSKAKADRDDRGQGRDKPRKDSVRAG